MLHILYLIVLYWLLIGLVCTVGWEIWIFKLKLVTQELRYRPVLVLQFLFFGTLFGPISFILGAYCDALHKSH
jgi:hypothetical protein